MNKTEIEMCKLNLLMDAIVDFSSNENTYEGKDFYFAVIAYLKFNPFLNLMHLSINTESFYNYCKKYYKCLTEERIIEIIQDSNHIDIYYSISPSNVKYETINIDMGHVFFIVESSEKLKNAYNKYINNTISEYLCIDKYIEKNAKKNDELIKKKIKEIEKVKKYIDYKKYN
jgi:hypothetical protein